MIDPDSPASERNPLGAVTRVRLGRRPEVANRRFQLRAFNLRQIAAGLVLAWGFLAGGGQAAAEAPIPPVPTGHPRVYVRRADLPEIKAKLALPEFARSWSTVRQGAELVPETKERFRGDSRALCCAFLYLVQGDAALGRRAVDDALTALRQCTDKVNGARVVDSPLHQAACVYDWCYDLLSPVEKQAFVAEFVRIAGMHTPGYPAVAKECLAVVGHDSEGWLLTGQLPAGVAIYDENPELYTAAARLFVNTYVPPRNYHYASHSHHQGSHYGTRLVYDLAAAWLFRRMGAGEVFSRDLQFVPYHWIYHLRPDGEQIQRGENNHGGKSGRKRFVLNLAATYYADPIQAGMAQGDYFRLQCSPMEDVFDLLFRPASLVPRPMDELPCAKFFPAPMGEMVARTGWTLGPDSRDVLVHLRLGGTFFGNHQKRDMGTFQIYYRGPLAVSSGYYGNYGDPHWIYAHETLASNGLLIYDPQEKLTAKQINTGGQLIPNGGNDHPPDLETLLAGGYEQGRVTAAAFGPDPRHPEYACLAGDITRAYGAKAGRVTRSMATLFTGDSRHPAMLVLYDRVTATRAEFKKSWVLHTLQEPELGTAGATVVCDGPGDAGGRYGGRLTLRALLPDDAQIHKIGGPGREFWVESTGMNYAIAGVDKGGEAAAWRLEISPQQARLEDDFLTALTVADAETTVVPPVRRLDGSGVVGAVFQERAVLFNRATAPATHVAFTWQGGDDSRILLCGLAGGVWRVTCDGRERPARPSVAAAAGCLYLRGGAGQYVLDCVEPSTAAPP